MPLRVAIQMDPIETVNIEGDSSFVMGLSAEARGHSLWHYHPLQLTLRDGKASARARRMNVRRKQVDHFTLGEEEVLELSTLAVILMRQDPPFDMAYITATHI